MKVAYFTHSLSSCWNHGNAHFLRGLLRELKRRGHQVSAFEPVNAWSVQNLLTEHGAAGLASYEAAYPDLESTRYGEGFDPEEALAGADLVLVHEWTSPQLVAAIGRLRARGAPFTLLFHDTHHRAVSDPQAMRAFDLSAYDGVLAFGEALAEVYRAWGWGNRAFVWHEAADVSLFRPPETEQERQGPIWIGNWGDGERTAELERFLLAPARSADLSLRVHGVRYPPAALKLLARYGADYRGWLPNADVPAAFAPRLATIHVPRRFYAEQLPGIPTIRVFEALACGVPLISAPWRDSEGLFRPDRDFLFAADQAEMTRRLLDLAGDAAMGAELARSGRETILARHTCGHRADELLSIASGIRPHSDLIVESLA